MGKYFYYVSLLLIGNIFINGQAINDTLIYYSMDSITVHSSRYSLPFDETPFAIGVIDRQILKNTINPFSLEESLNSQPGISVFNRNNLAQGDRITIRGIGSRAQFGVRGIKIFLDGIPLTFPDGQAQLNNLNIQDIESIEILKGPSSVIFGNSLGGAILIKSKSFWDENFSVKPSFSIGSYGLKKYSLHSGYNFYGNTFTLGGHLTESKGFRDHSESKFYGINLSANLEPTKGLGISVIGNYYNAPYLLNPGSLNKSDSEKNPESVRNSILTFASAKKLDQIQGGINLDYSISSRSGISASFYAVKRNLDNSIPGRIIDLKKNLIGIRLEFEGDFNVFDGSVKYLAGIDLERQKDNRSEFINGGVDNPSNINYSKIFEQIVYSDKIVNQIEKVNSVGYFSHFNFKLTEKLRIFSGIRYDDFSFEAENKLNFGENQYKLKMENLSFMLGYNYKIFRNINFSGNYSTGFQTPTTNELSNNPFFEGGFNTDLKSESVKNYELGIKWWMEQPDLFTNLSFYQMDFSDLLIGYQSEDEQTFYRNAGKAENRGLELLIEYYPSYNIKISASYNYTRFIFTDYILIYDTGNGNESLQLSGNYLPGIPENTFNSYFQYSFSENLWTRIILSYTDDYFTNDFNGPLPNSDESKKVFINNSYSKIDLISAYNNKLGSYDIALSFKIENLLDSRYSQSIVPNAFGNNFFEPSPGRTFYFTVSAGI